MIEVEGYTKCIWILLDNKIDKTWYVIFIYHFLKRCLRKTQKGNKYSKQDHNLNATTKTTYQ